MNVRINIPMISGGRHFDRDEALKHIPKRHETLGRIQRLLMLVGLIGVLLALSLPVVAGAETGEVQDQAQVAWNSKVGVWSTDYLVGEVFTAGISGVLGRVSLCLEEGSLQYPAGPVNISIQTVTDQGLPSGVQVGFGTIPYYGLPGFAGWVDVVLTKPVRVTAGSSYAILIAKSDSNLVIRWSAEEGAAVKPYSRGYQVSRAASTEDWEKIQTNQDWTFKTYVWPPTLDQSQTTWPPNYYDLFGGSGQRLAQTFTPSLYGMFDRISVQLEDYVSSPATGPVTVEVYALSGGYPAGLPLSGGMIPLSAIPPYGSANWIDVSMSDAYLTPGTPYALVLSTSGGWVRWAATSNGESYPSGSELIKYATGGWGTKPSYDMAFKTYVMPSTIDQAMTTVDRFGRSYYVSYPMMLWAQTFTASRSGVLDWVGLFVKRTAETTAPLVVNIHSMIWGHPSLDPIGGGTIPASDVDDTNAQWTMVQISGAYVTAGSQYAIVLDTDWNNMYYWLWGGDYAGGSMMYFDPTDWANCKVYEPDSSFQTYVIPAETIPGQPGPGNPPLTPADAIQRIEVIESKIADPAQIVTSDMDGANIHVKENRRETLLKKLDAVIASIEAAGKSTKSAERSADYQGSLNQLNAILDKTDGCVLRGTPDAAGSEFTPDWLVTCPSQALIDPDIRDSIMILEALTE